MKIENYFKLFYTLSKLLFNRKTIAISDCIYNTETSKCELKEKDKLCIDTNKKSYLITDNTGSCVFQNYNGNIFLSNKDVLISDETDIISKGYNCKSGICSEINNKNLYDNINNPDYYIYYDNSNPSESKIIKAEKNAVYFIDEGTIVTCGNNKLCKIIVPNSGNYYIDHSSSGLIFCSGDNTIKCTLNSPGANSSSIIGYFLNSGPDKSSKPIIYCDTSSCNALSTNKNTYYINSGSKTPNVDSLIYCSNSGCSATKTEGGQYYVGIADNEIVLILCNDNGCSKTTTTTDKGYYKNSGVNSNVQPLIYCNNSSSCESITIIEPGYYIDASIPGNIFYCLDNNCQSKVVDSISSTVLSTPGKSYITGNYIVMVGNFNEKENDYDNLYTNGDELLYFLNIEPASGFPGITTSIKTLFRITANSITRVAVDGIISVNDSTHKTNTNSANLSDGDSIYKCKKNKMICERTITCNRKTYFLDINNKTGFVCENNKLNVLTSGYYIDNGRTDNSMNNKYLIYCKSANNCISVTNPNGYYINGGQNHVASSNAVAGMDALIYCNTNSCITVSSTSGGYYVAGGNDVDSVVNNGYIYCSTSTSCENKKSNGESYYINSGSDKNKNGIIKCSSGKCQSVSSGNGYFISGNSEELIYCENGSNCSIIKPSSGYYNAADDGSNDGNKKIIECITKTTVICEKRNAEKGYYISNTSNILINCTNDKCKPIYANNGIFRSATTTTVTTTNYKRGNNISERTTQIVYNIITCSNTGCTQLSASELAAIPICTFENNKCFITTKFTASTSTISSIASGGYCTNLDHSVIYFATDTIVIDPEIIDGTTSIYVTTTTTTNCIEVINEYSSYYYTVNGSIYRIDDGRIMQETRSGYYFINVETNVLANGINIDDYNNPNIKLFKCNDNSCYVVDDPTTITYYTDVNKRIIQYNPNSDSYVFPYEKDITCIYSNNKCIPNSDLKGREFCITYKGELVLASTDIKSRETGDCYKSNSIVSYIFGYSQFFYEMNSNSAQIIETTGYYIVSLATNSTASYKDYNNKNNIIKIYGCVLSSCTEYEPEEGIYYYDYLSRSMYKFEDGFWSTPSKSGYVIASIIPNDLYIYKFNTNMNKVTLEGKAISGYYYTVDNE
eukprot:jgi/Orpsp1_1/1178370/evm.model.c7180000065017.1